MTIYLYPIDETSNSTDQEDWIEIDLLSWRSRDGDYPIGFTLLRRLEPNLKKPYLQELMFEGLYRGKAIKHVSIEVPNKNENSLELHVLEDVKVINYKIQPAHPDNKNSYEKIMLVAKKQTKSERKVID